VARLNCLTVGRADGLLSGASPGGGYPTAVLLADGRLMTTTDKGVAVVDPRSLQVNSQPPPVVIESVVADDQPLDLTPGQAIAVPHGTNRLEVRYTALSLIAPQRLRFRYQLEGSDPRWVEAAHEHSAHYTHLAPGSYVFRVLACNNDGVWNTSGASVAIVLKPYFYQTRWFAGLVAVGLAGLAFGIYSWRTMALRWRNEQLERRIAERTAELAKSYEELKQAQTVLLETSRLAGIAEMATGVLHNLGNALNSVNTTVNLTTDRVQKSKITALGKVVQLLEEQHGRLAEFFSTDPRGQQLPGYLAHLSGHLLAERTELLHELEALQQNVDHIKQIVAAQQSYAHVSGLTETVPAAELVEYGLRISEASLHRHDVAVVREFLPAPPVKVERQKVLQILVNLIRNAKEAINAGGRPDKRLVVGVRVSAAGRVQIYVTDNGVGIAPENLTRVFAFGYTTKKAGHGFGLHSSANVAKEMGGSLVAQSDGPGQGATFVLELPSAS
jgi:signal transduction histidine kinase